MIGLIDIRNIVQQGRAFVAAGRSPIYERIFWRLHRYYNKIRYNTVDAEDIDTYLYVSPDDIEYYLMDSEYTNSDFYEEWPSIYHHNLDKGRFNPTSYTGMIVPGDWDLYKKPYEFDLVYKATERLVDDDEAFTDSEYAHDRVLQERLQGNEGLLEERAQVMEMLRENLQTEGFLTQYDLGEKADGEPVFTESATGWCIVVNIGRNGEFIFNNSAHHRLAMSKALGLQRIPVVVVVRHPEWAAIRDEVKRADTIETLSERAKPHVEHPDVQRLVSDTNT